MIFTVIFLLSGKNISQNKHALWPEYFEVQLGRCVEWLCEGALQ